MTTWTETQPGWFYAYVETECETCPIKLIGIQEEEQEGGWAGTIDLIALSDHVRDYDLSWRGRLRNAWQALRGVPYCGVNLDSPQTVERLRVALGEMAAKVWPAGSLYREVAESGKR